MGQLEKHSHQGVECTLPFKRHDQTEPEARLKMPNLVYGQWLHTVVTICTIKTQCHHRDLDTASVCLLRQSSVLIKQTCVLSHGPFRSQGLKCTALLTSSEVLEEAHKLKGSPFSLAPQPAHYSLIMHNRAS